MLGNMLIPPSQVGPFPHNWVNEAPGIIQHFPQETRDRWNELNLRATAILGCARACKDVPVDQGRTIFAARRVGDQVSLTLDNATKRFDHVLLATGYRIDVDKMACWTPKLRDKIARHGGLPVLDGGLNRACPACISSAPPRSAASGRCCASLPAPDLRRGASPARRGVVPPAPPTASRHLPQPARYRLPPTVNVHELHAYESAGEPGAPPL